MHEPTTTNKRAFRLSALRNANIGGDSLSTGPEQNYHPPATSDLGLGVKSPKMSTRMGDKVDKKWGQKSGGGSEWSKDDEGGRKMNLLISVRAVIILGRSLINSTDKGNGNGNGNSKCQIGV